MAEDLGIGTERLDVLQALYAEVCTDLRWWRDNDWSVFKSVMTLQFVIAGLTIFHEVPIFSAVIMVFIVSAYYVHGRKHVARYDAKIRVRANIEKALRLHEKGTFLPDMLLVDESFLEPKADHNAGSNNFFYTSLLSAAMLTVGLFYIT